MDYKKSDVNGLLLQKAGVNVMGGKATSLTNPKMGCADKLRIKYAACFSNAFSSGYTCTSAYTKM